MVLSFLYTIRNGPTTPTNFAQTSLPHLLKGIAPKGFSCFSVGIMPRHGKVGLSFMAGHLQRFVRNVLCDLVAAGTWWSREELNAYISTSGFRPEIEFRNDGQLKRAVDQVNRNSMILERFQDNCVDWYRQSEYDRRRHPPRPHQTNTDYDASLSLVSFVRCQGGETTLADAVDHLHNSGFSPKEYTFRYVRENCEEWAQGRVRLVFEGNVRVRVTGRCRPHRGSRCQTVSASQAAYTDASPWNPGSHLAFYYASHISWPLWCIYVY